MTVRGKETLSPRRMPREMLTVLVVSCDAYSDCWPGFFHGMRTYWPDCPFDVKLLSNRKSAGRVGIDTIMVGRDRGWSTNLLTGLHKIGTPYVLMILEDFWLTSKVPTEAILDYVEVLARGHADYIKLSPRTGPDEPYPADSRLGVIARDAVYRTSTQVPLWRRTVLEELLVPGESAWDFEIRGNERSRRFHPRFLSVRRTQNGESGESYVGLQYVNTAVEKGEWTALARAYAAREGLAIEFGPRDRRAARRKVLESLNMLTIADRLRRVLRDPRRALRLLGRRILSKRPVDG